MPARKDVGTGLSVNGSNGHILARRAARALTIALAPIAAAMVLLLITGRKHLFTTRRFLGPGGHPARSSERGAHRARGRSDDDSGW
jgi:hypothetical protein